MIHHGVRDQLRGLTFGSDEPDQQVARTIRRTVRDAATFQHRLGIRLPPRRVLAQVGSDARPVHVVGSEVATALLAYVVSLDDII